MIEDTMGFKTISPMPGAEISPTRCKYSPPPRLGYLHVLRDILAPLTRVVVLPLISSITTVHESPRRALLDSRAAFLQTAHFRLFILLSSDMSVKSGKWARMHERSAG